MNKLVVPNEVKGMRIDVFLAGFAGDVASRSVAQKLIDAGKVQVDGRSVRKRFIVKEGDEVFYRSPIPVPLEAIPENIPLDIVFEDDDIIIVNKPKEMVVHPAPGHYTGTLVNALLFYAKKRLSSVGGEIRPGIVHRLDKDTSGLMVVAKNDFAHQALAKQLASRKMGRMYVAICHGRIKQEEFTIDLPIGRHQKDRKKMAVNRDNGRPAITHVRVLEHLTHKNKNATFIEARLSTGRTHQIRVHLAHISHPVLGDEVYGMAGSAGAGQILHAAKLNLIHPRTGEQMEFEAPIPEYFTNVLATSQ